MTTGLVSSSMGLVADSLDMLADSIVYGLAIFAVSGTISRKINISKAPYTPHNENGKFYYTG